MALRINNLTHGFFKGSRVSLMSFFLLCPFSLSLTLSPPIFHSSPLDWEGTAQGFRAWNSDVVVGPIRRVTPKRASFFFFF